jgi:hypothetical protein
MILESKTEFGQLAGIRQERWGEYQVIHRNRTSTIMDL